MAARVVRHPLSTAPATSLAPRSLDGLTPSVASSARNGRGGAAGGPRVVPVRVVSRAPSLDPQPLAGSLRSQAARTVAAAASSAGHSCAGTLHPVEETGVRPPQPTSRELLADEVPRLLRELGSNVNPEDQRLIVQECDEWARGWTDKLEAAASPLSMPRFKFMTHNIKYGNQGTKAGDADWRVVLEKVLGVADGILEGNSMIALLQEVRSRQYANVLQHLLHTAQPEAVWKVAAPPASAWRYLPRNGINVQSYMQFALYKSSEVKQHGEAELVYLHKECGREDGSIRPLVIYPFKLKPPRPVPGEPDMHLPATFNLISCHLPPKGESLSSEARQLLLEATLEHVRIECDRTGRLTILGGDFNVNLLSKKERKQVEDLCAKDALKLVRPGDSKTTCKSQYDFFIGAAPNRGPQADAATKFLDFLVAQAQPVPHGVADHGPCTAEVPVPGRDNGVAARQASEATTTATTRTAPRRRQRATQPAG